MKTAARMMELAAARPADAMQDVLGLAAICGLVFIGFVATAIG